MYVEFDQLADTSRVWIFQSKRPLSDAECELIELNIKNFIGQWQAHGNDLLASYQINYKRFLIVALDEASYQATGCSIDKLTHLIIDMEREFGLSLMDRMQITYKEKEEVLSKPMPKFKSAVGQEFDEKTIVFNNLIETKAELNNKWEVPLKDSWHRQMLS